MRLAIISDIHEDLISLQAALRAIEKFSCEEIICLGDISGYSVPYYDYLHSRNAHECLSLIRANCSTVILGNHDIHAASIIPKHCNFFNFPDNWYQLNYHQRHQMANNTLWLHEENDLNALYKEDDLEYLRSLPGYRLWKQMGTRFYLPIMFIPIFPDLKKSFIHTVMNSASIFNTWIHSIVQSALPAIRTSGDSLQPQEINSNNTGTNDIS